ncbi:hypothetical protein BHM03_00051989 [Ensete ventricosum]|nr:hypothetical protein BHM03_00051989 [Ensete ventricosum]
MNIYHLCQNLSTLRLLLFLVQFSMSGNYPYHKSCYKELYHPKCDVCKQFVSTYLVKRLYIKVISFSVRGIERFFFSLFFFLPPSVDTPQNRSATVEIYRYRPTAADDG